MRDAGKAEIEELEAAYGAVGVSGLMVKVSYRLVRLIGSTGGVVSIETDKWPATKRLVDEAIAHYQNLVRKE